MSLALVIVQSPSTGSRRARALAVRRTHAARYTEIAELFARPELAHAHRLRFTSPRQAAAWLVSLCR